MSNHRSSLICGSRVLLVACLAVFVCTNLYYVRNTRIPTYTCPEQSSSADRVENQNHPSVNPVLEKDNVIYKRLLQVRRHLSEAHRKSRGGEVGVMIAKTAVQVEEMLYQINPTFSDQTSNTSETKRTHAVIKDQDVCPEIYKGSTFGYPYFYKGFVTADCKSAKPFKDVLTILLNNVNQVRDVELNIESILQGIQKHHVGITVLIAVSENEKFQINSSNSNTVKNCHCWGSETRGSLE